MKNQCHCHKFRTATKKYNTLLLTPFCPGTLNSYTITKSIREEKTTTVNIIGGLKENNKMMFVQKTNKSKQNSNTRYNILHALERVVGRKDMKIKNRNSQFTNYDKLCVCTSVYRVCNCIGVWRRRMPSHQNIRSRSTNSSN